MPSQLKETLDRIAGKSSVLLEKYHLLRAENDSLRQQLEESCRQSTDLTTEVRRLKVEIENLRMARSVAMTPEQADGYRKKIAKMVRDIDRCINQLNA